MKKKKNLNNVEISNFFLKNQRNKKKVEKTAKFTKLGKKNIITKNHKKSQICIKKSTK